MSADVAGLRPVLTFNLHGRLQRLTLPNVLTVGRSPDCDLVLDHAFVSAQHCSFLREPGGVAVVDHDSSNGTRVNGGRVVGKANLVGGDVVEVGPFVLTLSYASDRPSLPPPAPAREKPLISLGPQMSTMTERPQGPARTVVEVVDGPRPRGSVVRAAFRDAVKVSGGATMLVVGDVDPCEDAGEVLGALRQALRDRASAGEDLATVSAALGALLERRRRRARALFARVDPATGALAYVTAHDGEPFVVRRDTLERLSGGRSPSLGHGTAPEVHAETLAVGDVLVLASASLVTTLRTLWPLEPPALGKHRRAAAVAMWLTNQAARNGEPGCAVCLEIVREPKAPPAS